MSSNLISGPDLLAGGLMAGSGRDFSSGEVIEDSESPKVVEWEDLQQELARLWSLSSALAKAKERKDILSQRLESLIEVRRRSLYQSNQLEEMRQSLEARKLAVGALSMRTKKALDDVTSQREQLCLQIRSLLVAGKTLSSKHQQLQEANRLLGGKRGHGNLKKRQEILRMRQQYMIAQVNTLYPVKDLNEQTSREKLKSRPGGNISRDPVDSSSPNVIKPPQKSSLTILGLQLTALPFKKMSFFTDKKEVQRSATALGYVAHAVMLIASYLDVPLRYPLHLGASRSFIHDFAPSIESTSSDLGLNPIVGTNAKPLEFPLFLEGQDTTRAAYAIFLLNKDLEQLLNSVGAESLGPRHVLANLKEVMRIIQSPDYID